MAWNLWKVVGGSKLLLLPFSGLVLGGAGAFYGTYRVSRSWTGTTLGVDFEEAGSICQPVSSVAGLSAAGGFLLARHSNYRPLPFSEILLRMERELHAANKTVTKSVSREGVILSTKSSQLQKAPPAEATLASWGHAMRFRLRLFLRAARVPARFYLINIFAGAALAGAVTSIAQRAVCGRTGTPEEVGKGFAATVAAKRKASAARAAAPAEKWEPEVALVAPATVIPVPAPVVPQQEVVITTRPSAAVSTSAGARKPVDSPRDQTD